MSNRAFNVIFYGICAAVVCLFIIVGYSMWTLSGEVKQKGVNGVAEELWYGEDYHYERSPGQE